MKFLKEFLYEFRSIFIELPRLYVPLQSLGAEQFEIPDHSVEVLSNWKLRQVEENAKDSETERAVVLAL